MKKFLYPHNEHVEPLEYEWEGYKKVWLFLTEDGFDQISTWYEERFQVNNSNSDKGKLEYYIYSDNESILISVLFADTAEQAAVEDLCAYIGSRTLQKTTKKPWRIAPRRP